MNVGEPAFEADAESQPVQATFKDHIEGAVNNKFVFKDLKWALFSFVLIFIYIAVVTNSIYLATLGMTHIFLSFFCTTPSTRRRFTGYWVEVSLPSLAGAVRHLRHRC